MPGLKTYSFQSSILLHGQPVVPPNLMSWQEPWETALCTSFSGCLSDRNTATWMREPSHQHRRLREADLAFLDVAGFST